MSSTIDDLETMLKALRDRSAEMKAFEGVFLEISAALAEVVECLKSPERGTSGLAEAIARIQPPQITVKVEPTPITVAPAAVTVMPQEWDQLRVAIEFGPGGSKQYVITKVRKEA